MTAYLTLFASAFIAATLFPASSEAVIAVLAVDPAADFMLLWIVATIGNTLGAAVNWVLGRFCLRWSDRKWFPISAAHLARAERVFQRWGVWALLFSWLPIIGDPLTAVAGILRVPFGQFLALVAIGKGARYAAILAAVAGLWPAFAG